MLKTFSFFAITTIILISCNQKRNVQFQQQVAPDQNNFFPVTQYIRGQIKELDSLPVTPLKISTINGKSDSAWIKKENIKAFVQPFLYPVIDSLTLHNYFTERSFLDQTINAVTFSYDPVKPLPDTMQVKHWDVYADPEKGKIKRIYIVKQLNTDPMQTMQLTWNSDKYCKITTITEKPNLPPEIKEEELIWNFDN